MGLEKAIIEAIVNGLAIGAVIAGVMIFSNQVSNVIIVRTTGAAMLLRFGFYLIENLDEVDAGLVGEYFGLPEKTRKGTADLLSFIKGVHIGKVI